MQHWVLYKTQNEDIQNKYMTQMTNTGPTKKPGVNPADCEGHSLIIESEKKMDEK